MHILTHTEVTNTMSPVYTTLVYEYRHENKGSDQFWYLESVVCRNETKNATRYVQYRFTLSTHKMHILTHTEVTNTMSPVYTTLVYEYRHENKGSDQFWYLESVVCRNETKNATRYVQYRFTLSTHKMHILTRTEVTNTMSPVYTTLVYEYRHENEGTDLVLVVGKCGV